MSSVEMLTHKIWTVVGATQDEDKFGYKIYKRLKAHGYEVYPVSPKYNNIDGDQVYRTLSDLPKTPEVVNFVVNPRIGFEVIQECCKLGIKNIWLQPGTVSDQILDYAKQHRISAVQDCVLVALPPK